MEEKTYSLRDMAEFTGMTERTLRNYLNQGLLHGEKRDGAWRFTALQLSELLENQSVRPSLQARRSAMVYDFLLDEKKSEAAMCTVLDLAAAPDELDAVSRFFCDRVNELAESAHIQLRFSRAGEHGRVILTGPAQAVTALMQAYYNR